MTWAEPGWLLGLLVLPVVLVGQIVWARIVRDQLRRLLSDVMLDRVVPRPVRVRRATRDVLVLVGLGGIVVALAEPRFDKVVRNVQVKGSDLVVLLDLSRSMDARDVDPSRLERARREVADLGAFTTGDRVGLVVFAGGAFARLPLTSDFRTVQIAVDESRTSDFDRQGSDLASAIRLALDLLERSKGNAGQAILVLSDGETHDAEGALAAAAEAAERNVPIFAMGIGERETTIPTPDAGAFQYKGETVLTMPNFDVLKQVAQRTGGAFVNSNATSNDMRDLYAEVQRSVVAVERSFQQRETYSTAFQYPLGLAVIVLLAATWLGDGRRVFGAAAAVLMWMGLASTPASAADPLAEADALYREQKFVQAAQALVELSLERPDDPEVFERLGAARYRAGDFEGAAQAYDRAATLSDGGSRALFNSGNAYYRAGRLEDALAQYEQALVATPDFEAAAHNRDLVQKEIAARRAPPPPPPPSGADGQQPPPSEGNDESQPQPQPQPEPSPEPSEPPAGDAPESPEEDPNEGEDGEGTVEEPGDPAGPITASQADRMIESVEEGSRRMLIRGRQESKPW